MTAEPLLLEISGATKVYGGSRSGQPVVALQDFDLVIAGDPASIVAVAGESGSGKTTLSSMILGFIRPTSGRLVFRGREIDKLGRSSRRVYRRRVQAVFQDPYSSFNPYYRVRHVFDAVIAKFDLADSRSARRELVEHALDVVGLSGSEVLDKYPHQLSGGQRQRVMMARAYVTKPDLIVADEPVSMVDASLRLQILNIMKRMRDDGISFLYITHDLSTAYEVSDEIVILYQGRTVEHGRTDVVLERPKHPYVQALVSSVPEVGRQWEGHVRAGDDETLRAALDSGCRFFPRCPVRMDMCGARQPLLYEVDERAAACFLYETAAQERVQEHA